MARHPLRRSPVVATLALAACGGSPAVSTTAVSTTAVSTTAVSTTDASTPAEEAAGAATVDVDGSSIHVERVAADSSDGGPTVLLLHGAAFTSADWFELGIAQGLAEERLSVLAIDLPGFGDSTAFAGERADFLPAFLETMGLDPGNVIIVSPSMSGTFSLPALRRPELAGLAGFVPVAPSGGSSFAESGPELDIPALVVRGDGDGADPAAIAQNLASAFAESEVWIVPDAGHPAYVDAPDEFVARVAAFARTVDS